MKYDTGSQHGESVSPEVSDFSLYKIRFDGE